jgi:GT2 family glycosyltransferase/streptogramin lyase
VSVVVCAYNAADTIEECLVSLAAQDYPDYEVIVVNDGSRDATGDIARRYQVRLVEVPNGGLSAARNLGLAQATGDIVAYTDADVRADRDWLKYLVRPIADSGFAGSGGPNVVPPEDPWVAQCVARAPGGPTHVLLDDRVAEHVPGCNMAFRRDALLAIGGFNPVYLRAGDDVDVCWRLQAKGHRIGFAPSALVWHHHRSSVKAYWRQQVGYGEGETWLDAHHPEKFIGGQMLWHGRIYSPLPFIRSLTGRRVNTGVWGLAAFPSIYRTDPHAAQFLPHSPAWMLISLGLCVGGVLLTPYPALGWVLLLTGLAGWATTIGRCVQFARRSDVWGLPQLPGLGPRASRRRYRALIAWLHFIQPIARIYGRVRGMWSPPAAGASEHVSRVPWKAPFPTALDVRTAGGLLLGAQRERAFWAEAWLDPRALLTELAGVLRASRPAPGVEVDDGWRVDRDLGLSVGGWGRLHVRTLIEEHAAGRCLIRVGSRLQLTFEGFIKTAGLVAFLLFATAAAVVLERPVVRNIATAIVVLSFGRAVWNAARALAVLDQALTRTAGVLGMTSLGRPGSSWTSSFAWRPLTAVPFVPAAVLLAVVASAAVSARPLIDRAMAHLPFGTGVAVAVVPARTGTETSGSVAVGASGEVIFADAAEGTIRRLRVRLVDAPRTAESVDVLANSASAATVVFPDAADVALAPNGDVYVADAANHRVCRIDRVNGAITTIAGDGSAGFDGDGGQAVRAALASPSALAVAPNGDLFIADTGNHRIRVLSARTGIISTIAGGGSGDLDNDGVLATRMRLERPAGVAVARNGDVYISDTGHGVIRRIDARTGTVSTVAGRFRSAGAADPGQALTAPAGIALAPTDSGVLLYVADEGDGTVRIVGTDGGIETLKTPRPFVRPSRLAYHPMGWLLVLDARADGLTAVRIGPGGAPAVARRSPPARKVT